MTKASIIIPAYNGEKYIRAAILSALRQTEADIEIIIVDDGSTDSTIAIINEMMAQDPRVRVYSQPHAGRPATGKNTGLTYARGKYICFLDQDDAYHPDKVRDSIDLLEANPMIDVLFHDVKYIDQEGKELNGSLLKMKNQNFIELAHNYLNKNSENTFICNEKFYHFISVHTLAMSTTSVMFRRSLLDSEKYRFPEDVQITDDVEFWWLLAKGRKLIYLDKILSYYRKHDSNFSLNSEKLLRDLIIVHLRNYKRALSVFTQDEIRRYNNKMAMVYFHLGYCYFFEFRMKEARLNYSESLRWSFCFKCLWAYCKTLIPRQIILLIRSVRNRRNEGKKI